jgi:hypothetical protein
MGRRLLGWLGVLGLAVLPWACSGAESESVPNVCCGGGSGGEAAHGGAGGPIGGNGGSTAGSGGAAGAGATGGSSGGGGGSTAGSGGAAGTGGAGGAGGVAGAGGSPSCNADLGALLGSTDACNSCVGTNCCAQAEAYAANQSSANYSALRQCARDHCVYQCVTALCGSSVGYLLLQSCADCVTAQCCTSFNACVSVGTCELNCFGGWVATCCDPGLYKTYDDCMVAHCPDECSKAIRCTP